MEYFEILKRAQLYIEKLANGIDPISDNEMPYDTILNQVRLARCFYFVNDILKDLLANGGKIVSKSEKKKPFVYDEAVQSIIKISDHPISLSEIYKNINDAYENIKLPNRKLLFEFLFSKGILMYTGDNKRIASDTAAEYGIWTEVRNGRNGSYPATLYNTDGQKFVINSLREFADFVGGKL